jgi:hypothetical protein
LKKGRGGRAAGLAVVRLGGLALALAMPPVSRAGDGVVRVVLFTSPTCPHCQTVREQVLPPLADRFAGQLQVAVLSTTTPSGRDIYWSAFWRYGVQQRGVPLLVVGDYALVGSVEIPQRLPTLIESYLAEGGVDWPPLPGLAGVVAVPAAAARPGMDGSAPHAPATVPRASPDRAASETRTAEPSTAAAPAGAPPVLLAIDDGGLEPQGPLDRLRADPQGNGLALLVLLGMVAAVLRSVSVLRRPARATRTNGFDWLTPVLALAGLGVAAYLAHVEVREVEAVCGPVGDCNTVQQSEYARLFGVVPIGVLGVLGFAAILVAWGVRRWGAGPARRGPPSPCWR